MVVAISYFELISDQALIIGNVYQISLFDTQLLPLSGKGKFYLTGKSAQVYAVTLSPDRRS